MTVSNLRHALTERPPPPAPWAPRTGASVGYQPLPYRSNLPEVPWIIRGNNAALSLAAIVIGSLLLIWIGA